MEKMRTMWQSKYYFNYNGHLRDECYKAHSEDSKILPKAYEDLNFSIIKVPIVREYLELEVKLLFKIVQRFENSF